MVKPKLKAMKIYQLEFHDNPNGTRNDEQTHLGYEYFTEKEDALIKQQEVRAEGGICRGVYEIRYEPNANSIVELLNEHASHQKVDEASQLLII